MKASLAVSLLALSMVPCARAQGVAACGQTEVKFEVKINSGVHTVPAPEAGKALVIFLQDDAQFNTRPRPTNKFGIDGAWAGATDGATYFYVSVDPGDHHLCAEWQSSLLLLGRKPPSGLASFTAEAGKVYYYKARDIWVTDQSGALIWGPEVRLEPMDINAAQDYVKDFSLCSSTVKKE
jgi:hypothetical protein